METPFVAASYSDILHLLVTLAVLLATARLLGEVILLGSPRGKAEVDVYELIHRTGVCLKGAHERLFSELADRSIILEQIMQYMQDRRLIVEPLIVAVRV